MHAWFSCCSVRATRIVRLALQFQGRLGRTASEDEEIISTGPLAGEDHGNPAAAEHHDRILVWCDMVQCSPRATDQTHPAAT